MEFFNGPDDATSSFYQEEVATQFDIQGLKLDWCVVCWDADYRYLDPSDGAVSTQSKPLEAQGEFENWRFSGAKWQNVKKPERQLNLKNTYGVLLTRAHQGMIICVPKGDTKDPTRLPAFYDPIANYLADCGINFLS